MQDKQWGNISVYVEEKNKQNITNLLSESVSEGERDFNHRWIKMYLQISPDLHIRLTCKAQQSSKPLSLFLFLSFFPLSSFFLKPPWMCCPHFHSETPSCSYYSFSTFSFSLSFSLVLPFKYRAFHCVFSPSFPPSIHPSLAVSYLNGGCGGVCGLVFLLCRSCLSHSCAEGAFSCPGLLLLPRERFSGGWEREWERERGGVQRDKQGVGGGKGQLSVSLFLLCVSDLWGLTPHSRTCGSHKGGELGGSGWRGCRLPVHLHVLKPEVSIAGLAVVELDKRCSGEVGV